MTRIIVGFPGVGKSYFKNKIDLVGKIGVLDSDSSLFSWKSPGVRHKNFPQNYIDHIKKHMGLVDIILVSSHKIVRDALVDNNLKFTLIYPNRSLKKYYLKLYKDRGSDDAFIKLISDYWDSFIDELEEQICSSKLVLNKGEFLSDRFMAIKLHI